MKMKMIMNKNSIFVLIIVLFVLLFFVINVRALPQSPVVVSNTTDNGPIVTMSRNDSGGTITTIVLNSNQQDDAWKGYVGNVSGLLSLRDTNSQTLYDWSLASFNGEVYASSASSVQWLTAGCSNYGNISAQYTDLNMVESDMDSINKTFNWTRHREFFVGSINITNSTCRTTYTFVNNTRQTVSETSVFQEVLLSDSSNLIFASLLEQDIHGFDAITHDFQMIVPDTDLGAVNTNYYFWLELTK
jgi:hypothetical protein